MFRSCLQDEEWKEIEQTNGEYYISSFGRVMSIKYDGVLLLTPYPLDNHLYIDISQKGKKKRKIAVAQLVAKAFIPNPENKRVVHHKNLNPKDNRVCNLQWVTQAEHNKIHSLLRK